MWTGTFCEETVRSPDLKECSITSQKTWVLNKTIEKTSDLAQCYTFHSTDANGLEAPAAVTFRVEENKENKATLFQSLP
jgi:hypothetical protein